jgi:hypothetical protein
MHAMYFPARACRLLATQSRPYPNTIQQNHPPGRHPGISPLNADPLHHNLPDSNRYINLTAALRRYIYSSSRRDRNFTTLCKRVTRLSWLASYDEVAAEATPSLACVDPALPNGGFNENPHTSCAIRTDCGFCWCLRTVYKAWAKPIVGRRVRASSNASIPLL